MMAKRRSAIRAFGLTLFLCGLSLACRDAPRVPQLAPEAVVLAFGDSLTAGTGAEAEQAYPAVLATLLQRRVVNAGVPGEGSAAGLARLPRELDAHRPQLLILCHGGNDLLRQIDVHETEAKLRAMIKLARERGIVVVLIGVPQPQLGLKVPEFYSALAKEFNLPYEGKILPHIEGERALKADMIHPNADGYRLLAQRIHALLEKVGAV